jgi:hypothetical protein
VPLTGQVPPHLGRTAGQFPRDAHGFGVSGVPNQRHDPILTDPSKDGSNRQAAQSDMKSG